MPRPPQECAKGHLVADAIVIEGVTKTFGSKLAVDNLSLRVPAGSLTGVIGPNGAGKTTTFYMVVGLIRPDEGRILLSGKDITHYPMYMRAREAIGYLSQEPSIFRKLSVADNIRAILEFTNFTKAEQSHRLETLLDELNVKHLRDNFGYSLSGGERRRVEIARAVATDPVFMLLDEPFAGVDPIAVAEVKTLVKHLTTRGIGVLITDHSVRETLSLVDRAYLIHEGHVMIQGRPEVIAADPEARRVYLGESFEV